MEITCAQMDILISFYIENDLSKALKKKVEEHLKRCSICRAKYDIIKSMLNDMRSTVEEKEEVCTNGNSQYRVFQNNLSAYVDNELTNDENIKIKKYTINNKKARKELEETYNIKRLMNDAFKKTKSDIKQDFSRSIMKQLELRDEKSLSFHPVLKVAIAFVMTVLALSAIIIFSLTL